MLSHFSGVWLFVRLWTITHQVSLSKGFSRQEYCSGLPCPPPGDLLDPGSEPVSLTSPAMAGGFFTTTVTWETQSNMELGEKKGRKVFSNRQLANTGRGSWIGPENRSIFEKLLRVCRRGFSAPFFIKVIVFSPQTSLFHCVQVTHFHCIL